MGTGWFDFEPIDRSLRFLVTGTFDDTSLACKTRDPTKT
jgi:hypothetical protein